MALFIRCLDVFYFAALSALHLLFVGRLTGRRAKLHHIFLYFTLLCAIQAVFSALRWGDIAAIGTELLTLYAVERAALGVRRSAAWTAAILAVYVSQLSFGMVNSVEAALTSRPVNRFLLFVIPVLSVVIALALSACCCRVILKFLSLEENAPHSGILLLPVLFFFFAELYILKMSYSALTVSPTPAERGGHAALLLLQALGLGALLCTLYAYRRICQDFQSQAALASLTQAVQAQRAYTAQAQLRYEKTKAFRHDLKNHLTVLGGLIRNRNWGAAEDYLKKMEAASAALSFPRRTGNPVADILLGEKTEIAEAYGIKTELSLTLPEDGSADPFDLCVILSNALDNAIAACRAFTGEKFIRVSGSRRGGFYLLSFENSCPEGPLPPEGTGLSNIRAAAEKYRGAVSVEKTGSLFRLHVLLNISIQPDNNS